MRLVLPIPFMEMNEFFTIKIKLADIDGNTYNMFRLALKLEWLKTETNYNYKWI